MWEQVLLTGGILAPIIYGLGILSAAAGFPGYRHSRQFISELGAADSPRAGRFKVGFGVSGILLIIFGFGAAKAMGQGGLAHAIGVGVGVGGVTNLLQAWFDCDPGCPNPPKSRAGLIHGLSGLLGSLVLAGTMLLAGIAFWPAEPGFAIYSFLASGLSILILGILMAWQSLDAQGAVQRLYVGVTFTWPLVFSVVLLRL